MSRDERAEGATNIESVMHETRLFPPPEDFAASAHVRGMEEYERLYAEAEHDPETFWARIAD